MDKRELVAKELLLMAKQFLAVEPDEEGDVEDPKFNEKIRTLRTTLTKINQKKRRRLQQFGIGLIRPNATVEDLVDALLKITTAG
jgi:sugar-specific transcriptional regulator TrmB